MLVAAVLLVAVVVSIAAGVVIGRLADNALARLEPARHAAQ